MLSKAKAFSFLNNREPRFETLDGLRGFLAISVFFHHFVITYYWKINGIWTRPPEDYYQNYGKVGVALFFMITGFLFISKLISSKWNIDWLKIFESRLFRIMPIYIFALALITAIVFHNSNYQLNSSPYEIFKQYVGWAIFYGSNINEFKNTRTIIASVDWTLKYEWVFYISLPIISAILSRRNIIVNYLLCGVILLLFIFPISFKDFSTAYAILFLIGGISAYIVKLESQLSTKINSRIVSTLALTLLFSMLFYPNTFDLIHVIIMSAFFMLIVLGNDIFGLLRLHSAKLLGEISYSIYLLHGLVLYVIFTQLSVFDLTTFSVNEYSIFMPIVGTVVVLFSSVTFLCIEKPFIIYGRKNNLILFVKNFSAYVNKALQRTIR